MQALRPDGCQSRSQDRLDTACSRRSCCDFALGQGRLQRRLHSQRGARLIVALATGPGQGHLRSSEGSTSHTEATSTGLQDDPDEALFRPGEAASPGGKDGSRPTELSSAHVALLRDMGVPAGSEAAAVTDFPELLGLRMRPRVAVPLQVLEGCGQCLQQAVQPPLMIAVSEPPPDSACNVALHPTAAYLASIGIDLYCIAALARDHPQVCSCPLVPSEDHVND